MIQSWKIFCRDIARLARTKKVWVILIGVMITPALYSWVNVRAFWDPYAATGNIKVAVVNEDAGTNSALTGSVNVGRQVMAKLKDNDQIGWQPTGAEEAEELLRTGEAYATITIPRDFSAKLMGILEGKYTKPELTYRVNEKDSVVAPQITDAAASKLDEQITSAFREQLATAATDRVRDGGEDFRRELLRTRDSSENSLSNTAAMLASTRDRIAELQGRLENSQGSMDRAKEISAQLRATIDDAQAALGEAQTLAQKAQESIADFTDSSTSAFVEGSTSAADATARARGSVAEINADLQLLNQRVDGISEQAVSMLNFGDQGLKDLRSLLDRGQVDGPVRDAIAALDQANSNNRQLLGDLDGFRSGVGNTVSSVNDTAAAVAQAAEDTRATATALRDTVDSTVPQLNRRLSELSARAAAFSAALEGYKTTLVKAEDLIDGVKTQLGTTSEVLGNFDGNLESMQGSAERMRDDLLALSSTANSQALSTVTGLNPKQVGQFFSNPVEITSEAVYPVGHYGSGMAALFTNLSLWIGAFMLMIIFRNEVDREGLGKITVAQAYIGRLMLLSLFVVGQATVVTLGNLAIGVQTVNAAAFVVSSIVVGLAYLCVVYALSTVLGHLGRGLVVVLVILQIPGASGMYPIELMPDFFRMIYPLLPFSYGINALRETIGGFYGLHYWKYMAVLGLMVVLSMALGVWGKRALAHFNLLFNRELERTGIVNSEKVQIVGDGYRIADVMLALHSREELNESIKRRSHDYRRWIRLVTLVGAAVAVVLLVIGWLVPAQKPLLLAIWASSFLVLAIVLLCLDYVRRSVQQAASLLDESELKQAVASQAGGLAGPAPAATAPGGTRSAVSGSGVTAADSASAETEEK